MDSESDSEDEPSPYDSPMAEEPDPAGSISARSSAGGEGEAERDAASPAAEEEEEREDHDAAVSEKPDSEADSLRAREDAEAAEWLGTPTKKEELWAAEKKEREVRDCFPYDPVRDVNAVP